MNKETEKINIVKRVCAEFNINQKELSELLGVGTSTVSQWSQGDIPKMAKLSLEQMIEIKELKSKLELLKAFKSLLNSL